MREKVKTALNGIKPRLQADGGDIDLIAISDEGEVSVKLVGACAGCPMSQMTLTHGVEKHLKNVIPEVTSVIAV